VSAFSLRHTFSRRQDGCLHLQNWNEELRHLFLVKRFSKRKQDEDNDNDFVYPPQPYRDESRFVWAGKNLSNTSHQILQSKDSTNPLLDTPRPIPDPYGWMRDESRSSKEVLDHIEKENFYFNNITSHLSSFRKDLEREFLSHIQETDYTAPMFSNEYGENQFQWIYYIRSYKGKSYSAYCRAPSPSQICDLYNQCQSLNLSTHEKDPQFTSLNSMTSWNGNSHDPIFPHEQIYLNGNELAETARKKGSKYFAIGQAVPSPSHKYIAYSIDTTGDERCQLYIKDLEKMRVVRQFENHDDGTPFEIDGLIVWGTDDTTLFYIKMDDTQRPFQVYRRTIKLQRGNQQIENDLNMVDHEKEELIFHERDKSFNVHVYKSQDGRYLFIDSASTETSEVWYVDLHKLDNSDTVVKVVANRRSKVLYDVEHYKDFWLITTNYNSYKSGVALPNMRLMLSPDVSNSFTYWRDLACFDEKNPSITRVLFDGNKNQSTLDRVIPFERYLVCQGRDKGLPCIWVGELVNSQNKDSFQSVNQVFVSEFRSIQFREKTHNVMLSPYNNYKSNILNVLYTSLVTPLQTMAINLDNPNGFRLTLKSKAVPNYEKKLYECSRTHALSRDGKTKIPISLVYRTDLVELDFSEKSFKETCRCIPVHMLGYGSYGSTLETNFDILRLPLLDRGFVCVLAHVRGGGELGRDWYEEPNGAKFLCKKNTFNDFIDVAKFLVGSNGITQTKYLSCEGRSAGGLLIGASINLAPHMFRVAILDVPFVDVACTMIDSTLPLTIQEWEEWGNPNEACYFEYILSYSPVHNVKSNSIYPACLLTGGLYDPRVQYWEPLKFAAELRHKLDHHIGSENRTFFQKYPICVRIDLSCGHFAESDRYKFLKEKAYHYAFLLDQFDLSN